MSTLPMTEVDAEPAVTYEAKQGQYFSNARHDLLAYLKVDPSAAILEVGCGSGATGAAALSNGLCSRYVGVEIFPAMAEQARTVLSDVVCADIEQIELDYPKGSFDALILGEVLEHLRDPWAALARLAGYVRPGGMILVSTPNISNWRVIKGLFLGRFDYANAGVMDITHLRWFTPTTLKALVQGAGVEVTHVGRTNRLQLHERLAKTVLGRRFAHLWDYQINIAGRKI